MANTTHHIPFTSIAIPMPFKDLATALVTVILFLPVVVIVSQVSLPRSLRMCRAEMPRPVLNADR